MSFLPATRCARGGAIETDPHAATSPPLYQTATFAQSRADNFDAYDYTRTDNPTRSAAEDLLAELEGARGALTFSSGMAAIAAVLRETSEGGRLVCGRDLYGGTQRLAHRFLEGVDVEHVDLSVDADGRCQGLEASLAAQPAAVVFVETPSNPRLEIVDLRAVARTAHAAGARLVVDGTAMTPWLQRPLELGADVVVHSATKGLNGHGDVTAGVAATSDGALLERLAGRRNAEGTALAPFESWLLLRGIRTLGPRIDSAQRTAGRLARWLAAQPWTRAVRYPGLDSHPGASLHAAQAAGGGILIGVETADEQSAKALVERTRLFSIAVSFGGVASSISLPRAMSHASVPEGAAPPPEATLVRLSIGLEAFADLQADLERAMVEAHKGARRPRATTR